MRSTFGIALLLIAPSANAADWEAVTTELLQKEKTGFGGLSGVVVDHATGNVFIELSDRGVFRSTDQCKTWASHGKPIKGRTETPGCMQIDPTGKTKTIVMATVYGGPIAIGSTESDEWRTLDKASVHVDWCAVDWSDPALKYILTLKHESGGDLLSSRDGGKSFESLGKGYGPAWIFDADTAVMARAKGKEHPKGGLLRTTDGGKTFESVGDHAPTGLPRWHDNALYWLADNDLMKSTDKGKTWVKVCDMKDGRFGPVFGKDAKHMFVLTGAGIVESKDGGESWSRPHAVPKALKGVSSLTWMDYDPLHDHLYIMKMGSDLYKLERTR
jgi:photosystem II stability/assembly factor-like uncharacterized protein